MPQLSRALPYRAVSTMRMAKMVCDGALAAAPADAMPAFPTNLMAVHLRVACGW
jgi:hypothetical protein